MPITQVKGARSVSGTIREEFWDFVPGNYVTGGIPVTAHDFGLMSIYGITFIGGDSASMGYRIAFNNETSTLYIEDGGTEVANDTSLSSTSFRLRVTGI